MNKPKLSRTVVDPKQAWPFGKVVRPKQSKRQQVAQMMRNVPAAPY